VQGGEGGEGWGWCGITSHITILVPTVRFAPLSRWGLGPRLVHLVLI